MRHAIVFITVFFLAGCSGAGSRPDIVWGRRGVRDGDLARPRACVVADGRLYVVDFTARIQAFDLDGKYAGLTWTTPDYRKGRPSGISLDRRGNLIVSDSHYNCFRIYSLDGEELECIRGEFGYVCDVVQDDEGNYYVAEFGAVQRISKVDAKGKLLKRWGSEGLDPGQFARLRAMALGPDGLLYTADACNHRIQVFSRDGELVRHWGTPGAEPGQLKYPYDLAFAPDGKSLYVAEYGNHRVQKFTPEGESLGCWGGPGVEPGLLRSPWGLAVDARGRVHVLDTENHRVQRLRF